MRNNTNEKEIQETKVEELNSWKQNDVYEEVDYKNKKLISARSVFSEKMKDRGTITKARLVALGFEEKRNDTSMNFFPTCSKDVLRVSLTIFLSQSLNSIDNKSAFLPSKGINDFLWGGSHVKKSSSDAGRTRHRLSNTSTCPLVRFDI